MSELIEEAVAAENVAKKTKKPKRWRRWLIALFSIVFAAGSILGALQLGCVVQGNQLAHWIPDYAKKDIVPLLHKKERTEEDYEELYAQTGLTKHGIDDLIATGEYDRILRIQECYFADYQVNTKEFMPFTYSQYIYGLAELCRLQEGDIILSSSIYLSWFRYGHSALVVDGGAGAVVDAVSIGKNSAVSSTSQFKNYAQFLVLRPKASEEVRKQAAEYAKEHLVDLPYMITVGVFSPKAPEQLKATHCSHLVWYAYKQCGLDIDGTGGLVVTPQDISKSDQLELVQNFGFDPASLWR